MQLIAYYALYGWDTQTCPHQFHVEVENEILCHEPGMSAVIFFLFAKLPVLKFNWEKCSRPSRFRALLANIYHVVVQSSS